MSKQIKKIIPYFFILIILVGLFSPMVKVDAARAQPPTQPVAQNATPATTPSPASQQPAANQNPAQPQGVTLGSTPTTGNGGIETDTSCGVFNITDCLYGVLYFLLFGVANLVLLLSGLIFNVMISVSINNFAIGVSGFVSGAWVVVRDLSNIFFILVLLYVAIQTILGFGHDTKKMIKNVVIMALLINFSMFFCKVVIDSSNMLALVFYNKLEVNQRREYKPSTPNQEKDIGGEIYSIFSGVKTLTDGPFLKQIGDENNAIASVLLKLGMVIISGTIAIWASYAFFIASFMFLGRMVELWILMIFSPFAFMSLTLPKLAGLEYIGWSDWLRKLISASFMAPIFMFFLYLIFKLMETNIFSAFITGRGFIATILGVLMPAAIVLTLLNKAVKMAKKGGGALGEKVSKFAEMAAGLAVTVGAGVATGGTALALRAGAGAATGKLASMSGKEGSKLGRFSGQLNNLKDFTNKRSFDFRAAPEGIKSLMSKGNIFGVQKGGWEGMQKEQVQKRQKRADELEKKGTHHEHEKIEEAEIKLKNKTIEVKLDLEKVEDAMKKARENLNDAKNGGDKEEIENAKNKLDEAKNERARIRGAEYKRKDPKTGFTVKVAKVAGGIADLEDGVKEAKYKLEKKSSKIREDFATEIEGQNKVWNSVRRLGAYSAIADVEAARKVRLGVKSSGGGEKKEKEHKEDKHEEKHDDHKPAPSAPKHDAGGDHGGTKH